MQGFVKQVWSWHFSSSAKLMPHAYVHSPILLHIRHDWGYGLRTHAVCFVYTSSACPPTYINVHKHHCNRLCRTLTPNPKKVIDNLNMNLTSKDTCMCACRRAQANYTQRSQSQFSLDTYVVLSPKRLFDNAFQRPTSNIRNEVRLQMHLNYPVLIREQYYSKMSQWSQIS